MSEPEPAAVGDIDISTEAVAEWVTKWSVGDSTALVEALVADRDRWEARAEAMEEAFALFPAWFVDLVGSLRIANRRGLTLRVTDDMAISVSGSPRYRVVSIGYHPTRGERERWWVSADDGYESRLRFTTATLQEAIDWLATTEEARRG